jgi:hypothetical protein
LGKWRLYSSVMIAQTVVHGLMSPRHWFLVAVIVAVLAPSRAIAQIASVTSTSALPVRDTTSGDAELLLESHLWRNFQPSTGGTDTSLHLLLRVRARDRVAVPHGLRVRRIIVTRDSETWQLSSPRTEQVGETGVIEVMARGGPAWTPGANVEVTVELHDARGRARRLLARAQLIRRLD